MVPSQRSENPNSPLAPSDLLVSVRPSSQVQNYSAANTAPPRVCSETPHVPVERQKLYAERGGGDGGQRSMEQRLAP
ncbi:unnamed protein product [Lota lota]